MAVDGVVGLRGCRSIIGSRWRCRRGSDRCRLRATRSRGHRGSVIGKDVGRSQCQRDGHGHHGAPMALGLRQGIFGPTHQRRIKRGEHGVPPDQLVNDDRAEHPSRGQADARVVNDRGMRRQTVRCKSWCKTHSSIQGRKRRAEFPQLSCIRSANAANTSVSEPSLQPLSRILAGPNRNSQRLRPERGRNLAETPRRCK